MPLKITGTVKKDGTGVASAQVNVKIDDNVFEILTRKDGGFDVVEDRDCDGKRATGWLPEVSAVKSQEVAVARGQARFDFVIPSDAPSWVSRFLPRFAGALFLQSDTYQRIKANSGALSANEITREGVLIAVLGCLAFGAASPGVWVTDDQVMPPGFGVALGLGVSMLLAWFIGMGIAYLVGSKLMPPPGASPEFTKHLRTVGYAAAPLLLAVLTPLVLMASIPTGRVLFVVLMLWTLIASVIATRQSLGYGAQWLRAIVVTLIGTAAVVAVVAVVWRIAGGQ